MSDAILLAVLSLACGYLAGSTPFGWLAGKLRGVDLREHGSKNIGATNAGRVLGRKWFWVVFACDFAKGCVPVLVAWLLMSAAGASGTDAEALSGAGEGGGFTVTSIKRGDPMLWVGLGACLGHVFPFWLRFRGGKAVATGLGMLVALAPFAGAVSAVVFVSVLLASRYVSMASILAALAAPVAYVVGMGAESLSAPYLGRLVLVTAMALLILARHRSNLKRIRAGTEHRISLGRSREAVESGEHKREQGAASPAG